MNLEDIKEKILEDPILLKLSDLSDETFHQVGGALDDMKKRVIRSVSKHSIDQDPLRMLRAIRYLRTLDGFVLDPTMKDLIILFLPILPDSIAKVTTRAPGMEASSGQLSLKYYATRPFASSFHFATGYYFTGKRGWHRWRRRRCGPFPAGRLRARAGGDFSLRPDFSALASRPERGPKRA